MAHVARGLPACRLALESQNLERRAANRHPATEFAIRVGVPAIDREHAALVAQLDRLNANPDAHPGTETFSEILSRLGRQINAHFDSEEAILRECAMPTEIVLEHIQAHTEILDQYSRLNLELMNGKALSRDEALGMIRRWIVDHVLHHDMKLTQYVHTESGTPPNP
ncbi:MAG: hemerythrin family protein [Rhodocyclales bacterium]|nr:hemerythrin family protein [Rhodocyclales bacterium]